MSQTIVPTGTEVKFGQDELIVSKTDTKGHITYANDVFCRISEFTHEELIGRPHNIIRHPDSPRGVFKLLWGMLGQGNEVFAYIDNVAKSGAHYWVLAHVTPTFDRAGRIIGFHSNRRLPDPAALRQVIPLYDRMRQAERGLPAKAAADASATVLEDVLAERSCTYEEFVWSLILRAA